MIISHDCPHFQVQLHFPWMVLASLLILNYQHLHRVIKPIFGAGHSLIYLFLTVRQSLACTCSAPFFEISILRLLRELQLQSQSGR